MFGIKLSCTILLVTCDKARCRKDNNHTFSNCTCNICLFTKLFTAEMPLFHFDFDMSLLLLVVAAVVLFSANQYYINNTKITMRMKNSINMPFFFLLRNMTV